MGKKETIGLFVLIIAGLAFFAGYSIKPTNPLPAIQEVSAKEMKKMLVTAYCPCKICCGEFADNLTATGRDATIPNGVAVDFNLIPRWSKLKIPGVGVRIADDTGGAMRQSAKKGIYHIDVRFKTHQEALNWGRQWLPVEILN